MKAVLKFNDREFRKALGQSINSQPFEIACPFCDHRIKVTGEKVARGRDTRCPRCRVTISLNDHRQAFARLSRGQF